MNSRVYGRFPTDFKPLLRLKINDIKKLPFKERYSRFETPVEHFVYEFLSMIRINQSNRYIFHNDEFKLKNVMQSCQGNEYNQKVEQQI